MLLFVLLVLVGCLDSEKRKITWINQSLYTSGRTKLCGTTAMDGDVTLSSIHIGAICQLGTKGPKLGTNE